MTKLAFFNLAFGFLVLVLAAAAGVILSFDATEQYLASQSMSWSHLLQKSSHGHTNLFALIHICFGLTLAYSNFSLGIKRLQTLCLGLGTFAMGPLMIVRSYSDPSRTLDLLSILIGIFLALWLIALAVHSLSLWMRFFR